MTGLKAFLSEYLFHRDARMGRIESALASFQASITELKLEIHTMSESLDQRLADLTALAQKQSDDAAKFRADVTAALAKLGTVAPMTPEQKAAFDNVTAILTASDTATVEADAALSPVPAAP